MTIPEDKIYVTNIKFISNVQNDLIFIQYS